jgi:hypothetical protein
VASNCSFFEGKPFTYHVDNCRAGGSGLALNLRRGNQVSVVNSTIAGQGDCLCLVECDGGDCDGSEILVVQNSIFMGYPDFFDPSDQACYIWFEPAVFGTVSTDYNVVFDAKIGNVGLAAHDVNQNPLVVNSNLETFDGHLQASSSAIDSGLPVGSLGGLIPNHDLENKPRPWGTGVDRGAYEFGTPPYVYVSPDGVCGGMAPCYSHIQEGIDWDGVIFTVKAEQGAYNENVLLNEPKQITLQGGWNDSFTSAAGATRINSLIIGSGTILLDQGCLSIGSK